MQSELTFNVHTIIQTQSTFFFLHQLPCALHMHAHYCNIPTKQD